MFVPTSRHRRTTIEMPRRLPKPRPGRDRLVGERTALINQLRAVLLERGFTAPQGRRKLEQALTVLLDQGGELPPSFALSPRMRTLVEDMRAEWAELDRRIGAFDDE